ncbi:hypothetical protein Tco_1539196 [Tanacetum coccineum]
MSHSVDDEHLFVLPEIRIVFMLNNPNSGNSTIDVVEDHPRNVPNVLPTHPILEQDFIPSSESIFAYVLILGASKRCVVISHSASNEVGVQTKTTLPKDLVCRDISLGRKEVDIIKKTENQAKMTKLSMEWKRLCKIKAKVMAIFVISVSSDSLEDSVGTPVGRVILFGTIPTTILDTTPSVIPPTTHIDTTPIPTVSPTIPSSPDYTPASPDYSPASDMEFDTSEGPSLDHIPPLPATLPFLSSTDDSSDSDIPDTPPSPTHGTPFTETTLSTQRSPVASGALRRRVMVLAPGQPIPHGRPYRYHLNGPVHMMTARKRVGPLPTHRLAVRHSVDYSSSDHFSSDDSSRDSSSSSSSESSSDSSADALSDSASSRSSSDHSLPTPSSGMRPSHHLCSLVPSIHRSSAISERPSHDSSSASPSRKRSRSPAASVSNPKTATDLEGCSKDSFEPYVPREIGLGVDFVDESSESSRHRGTDLEIDVEIDARVVVEAIYREEIKMGVRGPVEVRVYRVTHPMVVEDILEPAQEGAVEVTYETLGDLVQRFHDHNEDIPVRHVQVIKSVQKD